MGRKQLGKMDIKMDIAEERWGVRDLKPRTLVSLMIFSIFILFLATVIR